MIELMEIPLSSIEKGSRGRQDLGDIETLAESIASEGLIHPIAVAALGGGAYRLLAGERRLAAYKLLNKEKVPATIWPYEAVPEDVALAIELAENVHRKQLTWTEDVTMKKRLHELQVSKYGEKSRTPGVKGAPGWSRRDSAVLLQESHANTAQDLTLAEALEAMPELGRLKTKHEAMKFIDRVATDEYIRQTAERVLKDSDETPEALLHRSIINSFVVGDFFELVRGVEAGSVDLVEMDPPYGIDLSRLKKGMVERDPNTFEQLSVRHYTEVPEQEYMEFMLRAVNESTRVLKTNGWLLVWFGLEWYGQIYDIMTSAGLRVHPMPAVWNKRAGQCQRPEYYLANTYETFFYGSMPNARVLKMGRPNVFDCTAMFRDNKIHPTEKPIELMEEILGTFVVPASKIMVPFVGGGNTILAALNKSMTAFGFDLSKEYKDAFTLKVVASRPPYYKSKG